MTELQVTLWDKVRDFEIDDINSSFTFTDRLARENDWSLEYSLRAILEYKKFLFLVVISEFPLTPSDQIDQVWHLHLLYTQSYWIDFCQNTIQKQIHHGPTKGSEQKPLFKDQYLKTVAFYESIFSKKPPKDIWVDLDTRFKEIHFTRVNRHKNWIIPKLLFRK
ncbi:glycine-rich domain-containing protein [Kordia sp.]|uniref:glycine-rich domain-containing protein n=1 Tax=Kordia sp. TaxID=1965332 RepID=UPI003D2CB704